MIINDFAHIIIKLHPAKAGCFLHFSDMSICHGWCCFQPDVEQVGSLTRIKDFCVTQITMDCSRTSGTSGNIGTLQHVSIIALFHKTIFVFMSIDYSSIHMLFRSIWQILKSAQNLIRLFLNNCNSCVSLILKWTRNIYIQYISG